MRSEQTQSKLEVKSAIQFAARIFSFIAGVVLSIVIAVTGATAQDTLPMPDLLVAARAAAMEKRLPVKPIRPAPLPIPAACRPVMSQAASAMVHDERGRRIDFLFAPASPECGNRGLPQMIGPGGKPVSSPLIYVHVTVAPATKPTVLLLRLTDLPEIAPGFRVMGGEKSLFGDAVGWIGDVWESAYETFKDISDVVKKVEKNWKAIWKELQQITKSAGKIVAILSGKAPDKDSVGIFLAEEAKTLKSDLMPHQRLAQAVNNSCQRAPRLAGVIVQTLTEVGK